MSKAKISRKGDCDRFLIEDNLVWLRKCGRVKVRKSTYALRVDHVLKIADKIKKVHDQNQNRATGRVE